MNEALKRKALMHKVVSFVLFNVLWFTAVSGRNDALWLSGLLLAAQVIYSLYVAKVRLTLILQLLAVGLLLEAIATAMGTIDFVGGLLPLWLVVLWGGFAAMAPVALDWLAAKPLLAALLGAVSGPFSYWVGVGLGAGTPNSLIMMIVIYAAVWALFMLFFCRAMRASPNERLIL